MKTIRRRDRRNAERRAYSGRTLVALVAAAALTLGPGVMSAYADDSVPVDPAATTEVALAAPAPDPAPVPEPPAPEPPAPEPAPPAPELPLAPEAPPAEVPAETLEVSEAPAEVEEIAPAARLAEEETELEEVVVVKGDDNPGNQIDICHATGAVGKWVMLSANANGTVGGHADMGHQDGRDIIPPFEYNEDGVMLMFPGQNWDAAGQAIYENDCEMVTPPPPPPDPEKVTICHATGSASNPWVMMSPDANGTVSGHAGMDHQDGRDIIPPFTYWEGENEMTFPGQNWDAAGQAIWENDCEEMPPPPPNPVVMVTVDQCVPPNGVVPSTVAISISGLVEGLEYTLVVTGPGGFMASTPITHTDGTANVVQAIPGPGDYVATVTGTWSTVMMPDAASRVIDEEWEEHSVSAMQAFTVNPDCSVPPPPPPPPPASVVPALPITSSPAPIKALAVTGAPADGSNAAMALFLLLGAGAALLATGARRAGRSHL